MTAAILTVPGRAARGRLPAPPAPPTPMNYRRLGRSGLKVSELSFGSWVTYGNQLDADDARECMAAAYDAGVNFFDNAEVYAKGESEAIMGEALKKPGLAARRRTSSPPSSSGAERRAQREEHAQPQVPAPGDRRLAVAPAASTTSTSCSATAPTPTRRSRRPSCAMHDMIAQGKALYWGTSEWSAAEIAMPPGRSPSATTCTSR